MKGPFTSRSIEDILAETDAVFAEQVAAKIPQPVLLGGGIALEPTPPATPACNASETTPDSTAPDFIHRGSIFPENLTETELAKSVAALHLAQQEPVPLPPISKKPMTLLVDDNAVNLRLLEMYCKRRNIPYRTAKDGSEAVRIFTEHSTPANFTPTVTRTHPWLFAEDTPALSTPPPALQPFDLVLMDLQMPVCDGISATSQIRALENIVHWKKSVIFIVTGQDSPKDRYSAQEAGSDGYLVKPVGPKVLDRSLVQWFPDAGIGEIIG